MISGARDRRWRELAWSVFVSIVLNLAILIAVLHFAPKMWTPKRGDMERVRSTTFLMLEQRPEETPQPQPPVPQPRTKPVVAQIIPAAPPAHHELARDDRNAPPQPTAPPRPTTLQSRINADERSFANTVAKLNAQNGAHAAPTIDPATQEGPMKGYGFRAPAGMHVATEGNGIITPSQSWHEHGEDCYYAHYEYTYPDGAEETGNIVWPVCFDPGADPFREGRHEMPFPLPLTGYRLPPGTDLPPIEKDVYSHWISEQ